MAEGFGSVPQVLIFDTGPLWELVVYSAVHSLRFRSLDGELEHLRTGSAYESLTSFIANFQNRMTTPHVVAEISSLIIRRTERKGRGAIWERVYTEFSSMGMDESLLKLLEMPQKLVAEIGPTDVGILDLALRLARPGTVILSIDYPLISECWRTGINAKHLREVVADGYA